MAAAGSLTVYRNQRRLHPGRRPADALKLLKINEIRTAAERRRANGSFASAAGSRPAAILLHRGQQQRDQPGDGLGV